ncbi:MAG: hypothetical protein KGI83_02475 [Verrucomicrobiota bacterium]|nr:hypothetical protein [Verrucomicrobiota bacterium]
MHIASHHLKQAGHDVTTVSPHRFGKWLQGYQFGDLTPCDAIFLQYGNNDASKRIREEHQNVYTFFGSHKPEKQGPLRGGFDFVADLNRTMVDNIIACLAALFGIQASSDNGFRPPDGLIHRRFAKRIAIHATSGDVFRNWPQTKFQKFAQWAAAEGFEPVFLPHFPSLEELASFIYESGYFVGNDSGPGHIASCLKIPHLIIGREERHMRHWRPGWGYGEILTPPKWVPNGKGFRWREKYWSKFIFTKDAIRGFKKVGDL